MAALTIQRADVARASRELAKMRGSLQSWLRYRALNDRVMAGQAPTKLPTRAAQEIAQGGRDWQVEQKLASHLHALLSEVMPNAQLPSANVQADPNAAAKLAQIAITGSANASSAEPLAGPWYTSWPVLIVGGLLLAVTTAIKSYADVAKEQERDACIKAGACTDYGFWLKAAGVVVLGWFAWEKVGVGDKVKRLLKAGK